MKLKDVETFLEPMKLQCSLDGLEPEDLLRFELSPSESRAKGNMMAEAGRYPNYEWRFNGHQFTPGVGNKIYQASNDILGLGSQQVSLY